MHNITDGFYFYYGVISFTVIFFECLLRDVTSIKMNELIEAVDAEGIEFTQRGKVFLPQQAESASKQRKLFINMKCSENMINKQK